MNGRNLLTQCELSSLIMNASMEYNAVSIDYVRSIEKVIGEAVGQFHRVFAVRVDLRFVSINHEMLDMPSYFQKSDSLVMKRFIESLSSQLDAMETRKIKQGVRAYPNRLRYVWVREQDDALTQHYHCFLFFNKDAYCCLGNFESNDSLFSKINKAWGSAIGVPYADRGGLVHFPSNACYWITDGDVENRTFAYFELMRRAIYFAKFRTKSWGQGHRCIGCSRI